VRVRVNVSPRGAIMSRRAVAGIVNVEILDEHLVDVPEAVLAELASVAELDELLELDGGDTTPSIVMEIMTRRARDRAQKREAEVERRRAEATQLEARGASDHAADQSRQRALKKWVAEHGTEEQRERLIEGLLPESEILADVVDDVLLDIAEDEYVPLRKEQACDCEKGCATSARFFVGSPTGGLDARQFSALQRIREQAPEGAKIEIRLHKVHCVECNCAPLSRIAALVSVEWEGWKLMREYALK
jgi:hypothetical protein